MGNNENRIKQIDAVMTAANAGGKSKAIERMEQVNAVMRQEEALRREEQIRELNNAAQQANPKIGTKEIRKAKQIYEEYKRQKHNFDERMKENERWYNNNVVTEPSVKGVTKSFKSSWLFNALSNKHADFMDNYPEVSVLPREKDDEKAAGMLTSIVPVVFEQNKYKRTYSKNSWSKIIFGTAAYGIFWDPTKLNGLGDILITKANILNLAWQPGVEDIQDSPHFFVVTEEDNEVLEQSYPQLIGKLSGSSEGETKKFDKEDTVDTSKKSNVFEWYYKKTVNGKTILHYVKFVNDEVLFATENQTTVRSDGNGNIIENSMASTGLYNHGKYPYVFDILFPMEGVPTGAGYIDKLKDAQEQIDILNNAITVNARQSAIRRWAVSGETQLNEDDFLDFTKPLVKIANGKFDERSATEITTVPMSDFVLGVLDRKVEELKETGSNRDFSNGSTASGVTSGAAIAALQEAGSKTSRDAISGSYDATEEIAWFVIELMRQFYDTPRCFRITGNSSEMRFETFSNEEIKPKQNIIGERMPVFDIKVKAHKQNPFSKVAQNQDILNLFGMGFFNPSMADQALACLENLEIEGKERLIQKISMNRTLLQTVQQMQPILLQLATWVDELKGTQIVQSLAQSGLLGDVKTGGISGIPPAMSANTTNPLGNMVSGSGHPTVDKAKKQVGEAAEIK